MVSHIKNFAKTKLQMDIDEDVYSSYVQLDRPYVTWLLRVSKADALEAYTWWFPVVGSAPYKGFFSKKQALAEERVF